jgi:hypothetical protein
MGEHNPDRGYGSERLDGFKTFWARREMIAMVAARLT